jgi:hypothetical protein
VRFDGLNLVACTAPVAVPEGLTTRPPDRDREHSADAAGGAGQYRGQHAHLIWVQVRLATDEDCALRAVAQYRAGVLEREAVPAITQVLIPGRLRDHTVTLVTGLRRCLG